MVISSEEINCFYFYYWNSSKWSKSKSFFLVLNTFEFLCLISHTLRVSLFASIRSTKKMLHTNMSYLFLLNDSLTVCVCICASFHVCRTSRSRCVYHVSSRCSSTLCVCVCALLLCIITIYYIPFSYTRWRIEVKNTSERRRRSGGRREVVAEVVDK